MRTQAAWKVQTHMPPARSPTRPSIRSRISRAALLVKVMARICQAITPMSTSLATRWVSTLVLPLPAPAKIKSGPSVYSTASRCSLFKPIFAIRYDSSASSCSRSTLA